MRGAPAGVKQERYTADMDDYDKADDKPRAPIFDRRSLARTGLEVFSIVLGVLLALAVSEWQEDRNNLERTQAALQNVRNELAHNLEILEIVHGNNVEIVQQLDEEPGSTDADAQFMPALQISDSAWQALGATRLSGFVDFDLMVTLSQTYSLINIYHRSGYSLVDANLSVIATATATERDMKTIDDANLFSRNFVGQLQLIVDVESAVIDAHRNALAELDSHQQD